MKTIRFKLQDSFSLSSEISLCLGYFDGLHRGHMELVKKAILSKYESAILTLEFKEDVGLKNKKCITTLHDKEKLLSDYDIDYLFVLEFDNELKSLSPEEFINRIIVPLGAKEVVIGEDYRFGKKASGDYQTLIKYSNDRYQVIRVKELQKDAKKIGTSSIIPLIEEGNMSLTSDLLGRYYTITGKIEEGFKVGRKHRYPTANVPFGNYVVPKHGVYAVLINIDNEVYEGFCNVGTHPTINELLAPTLEVHIFDFNQEIYGKSLSVSFVDFIREEMKFDSVEDLYQRLEEDKKIAKSILSKTLQK